MLNLAKYPKIALMLGLVLLNACGKDEGSPSSAAGNVAIVLKSTTLSQALTVKSTARNRRKLTALSTCSVTVDGTPASGRCYTPIEVSGSFNQADLGTTSAGTIPVRILGGGTETGLASVFKRAAFNLKSTPTISGQDNIEDGSASAAYNYVSLEAQYLEYSFTATASNEVFHVREFLANNVPSTDSVISGCNLGSGPLAEADSLGTLFTGMTAQAGDIMVCIKSNTTDTCLDSEYQWVNSSDGSLQSTRPASPKKLTSTQLLTTTQCTNSGGHPDMTWSYGQVQISLNSNVSVTAAFGSGGVKTYTTGGSSGSKLNFVLDITTTDSLFVPNTVGDISTLSEAAVLGNIEKIQLKPIYVANNKTTSAPGDTGSMLSGTATLTVE